MEKKILCQTSNYNFGDMRNVFGHCFLQELDPNLWYTLEVWGPLGGLGDYRSYHNKESTVKL